MDAAFADASSPSESELLDSLSILGSLSLGRNFHRGSSADNGSLV